MYIEVQSQFKEKTAAIRKRQKNVNMNTVVRGRIGL
jgi:hypothetical protein